jgi:hypothetical protein
MNNQFVVTDEVQERVSNLDKFGLALQKVEAQTMHTFGNGVDISLWIDIALKTIADHFQHTDFYNPVAIGWFQPCGFGIKE